MLDSLASVTVNRTQALVLGFFLVVWVSLLVILVGTPEVFDQALRLPTDDRVVELAVLAGLSGFIGLLAVGVVRRWRWTFWLILVAFLFGVLRVPAAVLQLTGILATNAPTWYVTFQALLGVVQFGIGLVMVVATAVPASGERTERSCDTGLIAPMGHQTSVGQAVGGVSTRRAEAHGLAG
jgi:hypothetical protein